ncbi:phosphoribosylanthranilate isomerase [Suhomyces tanzawaensis NRRL Y-17324]|uniref:N-(5'-phosphoribosyl)anthranilate isomerase n=1 Tax=Suhomyces tanzawaensis NRRL Y-17324 TaxID=984487 RepID=A0A1E4SBP8_9ASCO|nr:phosphoribosylanthranilate isomerase [Suhomyces tanzawaensis NRRL Y-17324]ODV76822.1 phosphoribosylanthranilate isomerase [Suhomyces tanzawaensis NRRL Y-17324]
MTKLVKICGLKSTEAAAKAIDTGADLLGFILVPNRARTIDNETASAITARARQTRIDRKRKIQSMKQLNQHIKGLQATDPVDYYEQVAQLIIENGPFTVGVFRNQHLDEVYKTALALEIDFIQLHGSENKLEYLERNSEGNYGLINRYVVPTEAETLAQHVHKFTQEKELVIPLLDSEAGGEGKVIDWEFVNKMTFGKFIMAGGLTPSNLEAAGAVKNVLGYDVSGGVETDGVKDLTKIEQFIVTAKGLATGV